MKGEIWEDPDNIVWISMVQHYAYCPRQWALIECEQVFEENIFTLRGRVVHELVDYPVSEVKDNVHIEQALPIWSEKWGLIGKADVIEFHADAIIPVEYKHGPRKRRVANELQVTAQAVCLEEMFGQPVRKGYIYHHKSRRRQEVIISDAMRWQLKDVLKEIRDWRGRSELPRAPADERCQGCSLIEVCLPQVLGRKGLEQWRRIRNNIFL